MSYQSEVLADSPWGFWLFTETSGTTLADSSGNGRPQTLNLSAHTLGQDGPGALSAVAFSSAEGYAMTADATFNTLVATVEAWVYLTQTPTVETVLVGCASGYRGGISDKFLSVRPDGGVWWYIHSGGSRRIGSLVLSLNEWHHVVGTIGPDGQRLYVDGVAVASAAYTASYAYNYNVLTRAGGSAQVGTTPLRVAAPAVYSTQLSAARVAAHFEAGVATDSTPTTATGALAVTAPAHTAILTGLIEDGPITGALAAASPAHAATIAGTTQAGPTAGGMTATAPAHSAAITADVPTPATRLEPWAADDSQRTRLVLRASGTIDALPALDLPPIGFTERTIMRRSVTVPALNTIVGAVIDTTTGAARVPDDVYAQFEDAAVVEEVGVPHIVFPNIGDLNDVTYFRGGITRILRDRREEPFGDVSMVLELPQVTSMDDEATESATLSWTQNRANAEIVLRKSDGTITRGVWAGHVVAHDTGNDATSATKTLTCQGSMWQAATDVHKVPTMLDPTDIGTLIPKALNSVSSHRYAALPAVTTGILSKQRGSWSDSPMAYAQNLLATAWTPAGRQWTVAKVEGTRRTYEMRLKKSAPSWTVTNGARGVDVSLTRDATVVRNVVYGHGVGPDGYAWWNYHYPNLRQDDAPAYPYSSASTVMTVGSTDAGTASGEGVSVWQERARDLGYNVTINGTFDADDATAARAIQRRYGLTVDGVVGPQTWAGTFDIGGNGGDLTGAIRLPLAADPRTQRWLFNADGSVAGENPAYDVNVIVYAADVDFGAGVTREEGITSAQQIVDRESEPGLTGRITLRTDPREGSRLLIPPGDKIVLAGYEGSDRVLHITAVERDWQNLTVTLEVDEKSRDAMTLAQIRERNREARRDPARRPGNVNRRSRLDVDSVVPFDGESGAGWIPRHAIFGGLWTVIRVPVSEVGRIAKVDVRTAGPAAKFCLALFGRPIQPAHLVKLVGDPLSGDNPFARTEAAATSLDEDFGFIEAFGGPGSAAGYWPKQESDGALTGRLIDTGGLEYVSQKPPWVWVAEWSPVSTFISGRLLPAPVQ